MFIDTCEGKKQDGTKPYFICYFLRKCRLYGVSNRNHRHGFYLVFGEVYFVVGYIFGCLLKVIIFLLWAVIKNCSVSEEKTERDTVTAVLDGVRGGVLPVARRACSLVCGDARPTRSGRLRRLLRVFWANRTLGEEQRSPAALAPLPSGRRRDAPAVPASGAEHSCCCSASG